MFIYKDAEFVIYFVVKFKTGDGTERAATLAAGTVGPIQIRLGNSHFNFII